MDVPLHIIRCEPPFTRRILAVSPRVLLESDARSAELLPEWVRSAADDCAAQSVQNWRAGKVPAGFDGVLTWLEGEQLLAGPPAALRQNLRVPGRRSFLVVHRPCLAEMPLLTLEPRSVARGLQQDYYDTGLRIASPGVTSPVALEAIGGSSEAWAQLSGAVLCELQKPGAGIEALLALWQTRDQRPEMGAALAVRNLFVALLRLQQEAAAERILLQGQAAFPGCAELWYLAAVWHLREGRPAQAFACLERTRTGDRAWVGVGGESSYRADWLRGVLARRAGNQRVAFEHLRRAIDARPLFSPAVEELSALRLPRRLVEKHRAEFCHAALADPRLLAPVFNFFLQHRTYGAAGQLLQAASLGEEQRSQFRDRLRGAQTVGKPRVAQTVPGIVLSGPLFEHTSLARINREIGASLLEDSSVCLSLESPALSELPPGSFPEGLRLEASLLRPLDGVGLTIRHQWPPDFRRPAEGKLAVILPWEYGAFPEAWVREINENVDELWVPSNFVRKVLRDAGVARAHMEVIPNGFDPAVFHPDGPASRPPGCRGCAFLFVGGAIRRKGLDLLLEAYAAAFDPGDDVTLVVYASGASASYRHNSLTTSLQAFAQDERLPHLQILTDFLDDATLAQLYRGCDTLVLPYRGEGFGMPLLEAMACGKPVIATDAGPAPEFCKPSQAYLLPAAEVPVPDEPPPLGPLAGEFTWFEPDFAALVQALRRVYEKRSDAAARGQEAARAVCRNYTWKQVAAQYRQRIHQLVKQEHVQAAQEPEKTTAPLSGRG